ncbi:MAG: FxsA family protein [Rhodothermales bacterium]|nr:FxsA family protein [Rhodothermales bacterium]
MFRANLFIIFVVVPIVEIALLVQVGQLLGFWPTMGLVVLTAAVGSSIAAREGTAALAALSQSGPDTISVKIADAAIILVCGFLLLTPGILTDAVGLLGLFPLTRPILRRIVMKQFGKRVKISHFGGSPMPGFGQQNANHQTEMSADGSASGGPVVGGRASTKPRHTEQEHRESGH